MNSNLAAKKPLRILLAEDNKVNQILTLGLLRSLGYTADTVVDGQSAIEAATNNHYDLILMDCELPIINGYDAVRAIRRIEKSRTFIAAYTAHVSERELDRCAEAGMQDVLAKPISFQALTDLLNKVYDGLKLAD